MDPRSQTCRCEPISRGLRALPSRRCSPRSSSSAFTRGRSAPMKLPFYARRLVGGLPVSVVAVAALVVLLADLFSGRRDRRYLSIGIALLGTIIAGELAARQYGHHHDAFFGGFIVGGFATVFQEIILISAAGSIDTLRRDRAGATHCRDDRRSCCGARAARC